MSKFSYTQEEAEALIQNSQACTGCRQDAAKEWSDQAQGRGDIPRKPKIAFMAMLLNNSGPEPHTCAVASKGAA